MSKFTLFFGLVLIVLLAVCQAQITEQECKRDCTLDFSDCSHLCAPDNKPACHQRCSKIVKGCVSECPKLVCYDKCRVDFENCRDHEEPECEEDLDKCQNECDRKAVHVKDEI